MFDDGDMSVGDSRALLTKSDRQYITNDKSTNQKHQSVSRVRNRIHDELATDIAILKENHEQLYQELMDVIDNA